MTRTSAVPRMPPEFEAFLFAAVGEDVHGTSFSVLSALARLDVDPWREAAKLADLPKAAAKERLARLIAALPDVASMPGDAGMIAARLIALLPGRYNSKIQTGAPVLNSGGPTRSRMILFMIFLVLILGFQYLVTSHHSPASSGNAHAPTSSVLSLPISPPAR